MRNTYKKPKPFFMVYAEGGNTPACKHETLESAEAEADRLSNKLGVSCYVLRADEEYEPMPEPKFKVGDRIRHENMQIVYKVAKIENGFYYNDCGSMFLNIANQGRWELAPIEVKKHKPKRPCWFKYRNDALVSHTQALFKKLREEGEVPDLPDTEPLYYVDGCIMYCTNNEIHSVADGSTTAMMIKMFGTELRVQN